ncbi:MULTISPECIES: DNA alkylation repair protein [Bacillaceae]|uniref:DNA alkylation repair protein n=1 Tax=Bacillaceae TaxID=186817 RepID=UPI000C75B098|nr:MULTISPECIES: DNA alkylation repair protein [Bacillaceae]PLR66114.1 DNA alkylation repair protein [Bacillus sp. UMB0893]QNG60662.1 DNA alkylation repair protein [Bacillus sp. PAMC26568]
MHYANNLRDVFLQHADLEKAISMENYMRNQFRFLGIKSPERKEITKQFLMEHGRPDQLKETILKLWSFEERELLYAAMDILVLEKKKLHPQDIEWIKDLIITVSWWDTVDLIASNVIGPLVMKHPELKEKHLDKWAVSENFWLQRTAILYQLKYKQETDEASLYNVIRNLSSSKEFFIQKAIGWALREYSKTNPESVHSFISENELAPLSKREGMKHLSKRNAQTPV